MARIGKDDLVEALSRRTGVERRSVEAIIEELPSLVADYLVNGDMVAVPDLGRFERKWRQPRRYGHPRSGDVREAPGHYAADFRPFRYLADRVEATTPVPSAAAMADGGSAPAGSTRKGARRGADAKTANS